MKKSTWVIIFVVIIVVIGLLLFMAFKKPSQKEKNKLGEMCPDGVTPIPADGNCPQSTTTNTSTSNTSDCTPPSSYTPYQYPISLGMKGKTVTELQHKLNIKYKSGLKEDGFFGCNTLASVKENLGTDKIYTTNPIWAVQEPILG
jgi:hypothetical protein